MLCSDVFQKMGEFWCPCFFLFFLGCNVVIIIIIIIIIIILMPRLTGSTASPSLFEVIWAIGREEVLARLRPLEMLKIWLLEFWMEMEGWTSSKHFSWAMSWKFRGVENYWENGGFGSFGFCSCLLFWGKCDGISWWKGLWLEGILGILNHQPKLPFEHWVT